ncbi:MAG: TolC family protein [Proteobacteria bacterium]|nr:TolC family protein [Pseudomonadota bacterium]
MLRNLTLWASSTFLLFASQASWSNELLLNDYLLQVKTSNTEIKSSVLASQAADEKSADAEMMFKPTVFATIQTAHDKRELSPVSQRGSQTNNTLYQGGVSKLTEWGTAAKLYYSTSNTSIRDTEDRFVPEPTWYDAGTTMEVSQPLLKNSLGRDFKNSIALQKGQSDLTSLREALKRKFTLVEAEATYWRLVIARESARTAKDNLDRANRIVQWNRKRVNSELADAADLIQAEALSEVREIELTIAQDEITAAGHAFNTVRGSSEQVVKEELAKISAELLASIPVPQKTGDREDVQLSMWSERLAETSMNLAETKYDPSLDLFASATANGRDSENRTKAVSESFTPKFMTWAIGLKLSAPIGGETASRVRGGYAKDKESASLGAARKRFEGEREWLDLSRKLAESKHRLTLVQKVELTQKKKLDAERDRQNRGRSTMFQVTQYETDYAQSQLNVIRNKAEILGILARMKTFGGQG